MQIKSSVDFLFYRKDFSSAVLIRMGLVKV